MAHGMPVPHIWACAAVTPCDFGGSWSDAGVLGSCNWVTWTPFPLPVPLLLYDRGYCLREVVLSSDFPFWYGLVTVSTNWVQKKSQDSTNGSSDFTRSLQFSDPLSFTYILATDRYNFYLKVAEDWVSISDTCAALLRPQLTLPLVLFPLRSFSA